MDHPIISADGHIDLPCLPERLFVENAPAALRARMPRVEERADGRHWMTPSGVDLGLVGGMGSGGRRYEPGQIHRADRMAETGLYADQARGVMRTTIPPLRIRDQERDGVCAEVIYGILGAAGRVGDPVVAAAMGRIYNDFAAGFRRAAPQRFAMIGCLPSGSPAEAAAEIARCRKLDLAGVELPLGEGMLPLWREDWDPVWSAAQEHELPVHLHTVGSGADRRFVQSSRHYLPFLATVLTGFQLGMASHVAAIIFGGALERFPRLRVVMGEAGIGWIPYVLERMDYEWEDQFRNLELRMRPSDYWARQMFATFQQDEVGIALIDRIGAHTVLWGSDFPHPDGIWPDSREHLAKQLGHLHEDVRRQITFENAARLYGIDPGAAR